VSNPLGVYWTNGATTLNNNVTINGTLIVKNGNLTVQGKSDTITAQSSMPALVIDDLLVISGMSESLTVNGLTYAGSGLEGSGITIGSNLTVNGALLCSTGSLTGSFLGTIDVTYNSSNSAVPNFSASGPQFVQAVKIVSWSD
jgi:hypothetical protein